MFKHLLIVNLLIMAVVTQDMPPPDLDLPSTTAQPTTPETTTEILTTTTTTEATTTPTETDVVTTTEAITTSSASETTTTEAVDTTPESTTTTTTIRPTTTTTPSYIRPFTDSPFTTTTTTTTTSAPQYPFYPSYPNYNDQRCYYKKQYGFPQVRWSCHSGLKYFYPVECFKCCLYPYSSFAGCYRVHGHHCNIVNHHHGFYK